MAPSSIICAAASSFMARPPVTVRTQTRHRRPLELRAYPSGARSAMGDSPHPPLHELLCVCERGGRGARGDAGFHEDVADVALDRLLAEIELASDALVGHAGGEQPQHLELARGEAGRRCTRAVARRIE